ncbi:MAG: NAD-dependent epimerase/dehydratase family protein [Beijerinckiaceae bacterium]
MKVIVTGAAGFIGSHVSKVLLARGDQVVGIDSMNTYYDPKLKRDRLASLLPEKNFTFLEANIADRDAMFALLDAHPDAEAIIHLAAQAGVRHSLIDPYTYVDSNVMGQVVMFELAKRMKLCRNLVYASSSSVYGRNTVQPFSTDHTVRLPASIYAATKLAGEHLAEAYSWSFGIPATGLRFFTVYGPWGRPDMAAYLFADAIVKGNPIRVFNHGNMKRDFTYVDDIAAGVVAALDHPPVRQEGGSLHKVYNLGNNKPEKLLDFIGVIEQELGRTAEKIYEPMQVGDVPETSADISISTRELGFVPRTPISEGLPRFIAWFKHYHGIN